jgi:hypothetical protein
MASTKVWLVLDMDEGLIRIEPTRKAAVKWCTDWYGPVLERNGRDGAYYYVFGDKDSLRATSYFIERYDAAVDPNRNGGWENVADGPAKFPYADRPYDRSDDPEEGKQ